MKFSFVVAAYNVEKYIIACIDSILEQLQILQGGQAEIIVINDGSTDNTLNLLKENYEENTIINVVTQKNAGPSAVRNNGVKQATGDYIFFIDGDDLLRKDALEPLFDFLKDTNSDMVAYSATCFDGIKEKPFFVCSNLNVKRNSKPLESLKALLYADYTFGWVAWHYAIKRSCLIENNLQFVEGKISEDVDFILRLYMTAKTFSAYCGEAVYAYRITNSYSISHSACFAFTYDLAFFVKENLNRVATIEDEELKALLYLNYQTLIEVILYWYTSYQKKQRSVLLSTLKEITAVYATPKQYDYLYRKKELLIRHLISIIGFDAVAKLWGIKRKWKG